jgi:D-alanyl-D-alanine endopeptidase (penicillin-binding protein 7)
MKKFVISLLICVMTVLWSCPDALAAEKKSSVSKKTSVKKTPAKKTSAKKTSVSKTGGKQVPRSASKQKKTKKSRLAAGRVGATGDSEKWSGNPRDLSSASVLVMDQTNGKILLEKNSDAQLPIASISKLMTAMVVLDAKQGMDEIIAISDEDVDYLKGTRSRLQVGTRMSRDTALLLALMSSENRAANALGRHYPGGLSAFVAAMNRKARALGLVRTRFEEPTGLSVNNVSTPRELARMVAAAHQYAKIREYSTMAEADLDMGDRVLSFTNTNTLVKNAQWQIGLSKTGYISEAGRCLVMQAWVARQPVVIVLLDSVGKMTRIGDANRIKRWMESTSGFSRNTGA